MSDLLFEALDRDTKPIGASVDVVRAVCFEDLLARYREPQRRYHGFDHLFALCELMDKHAPWIPPGSASRLAIWWHDAIYDPTKSDNEEQSAVLARDHLKQLGASTKLIDETADLILMTKNHWSGPSAGDGDYFLDADIAILGAPPAVYDRYSADVRQEYSWAPDELYRAGRSSFLKGAITRQCLFRTAVFENTYSAQARTNMTRELASLV